MPYICWNVDLATLGDMTFRTQKVVLADAMVLADVSGSDMVSLLFMPLKAVVVEIVLLVLVVHVFYTCPEVANQACNCGKVHRPYYSPYDATLFEGLETRHPIHVGPIHQTKYTEVASSHTWQRAVQASNALMFYSFAVEMDSQGIITTRKYDHLVPQGMLYSCDGQGLLTHAKLVYGCACI